MLSDDQLEIIGEAIRPLFQYLEQEIINDVAQRIKNTMAYTRTSELQAIAMRELGYSPQKVQLEAMKKLNADSEYKKAVIKNTMEHKKKVRDMLKNITKQACTNANSMIASAAAMSWADDLGIWEEAGKKINDKSFLPQLINAFAGQTSSELANPTQTTGFKVMSGFEGIENLYIRELDKAAIKICSGSYSQDKVVEEVIHDLAQIGLRKIDFASGYTMQLDTAACLALRTGCHQIASKIMDEHIKQTGVNLVYVSEHVGARNKGIGVANHENWQGKIYYVAPGEDYSEEEKRTQQNGIEDLWKCMGYTLDGKHVNDPSGLNGYNCRHNYYPWFEGISFFPKKEKVPKDVTINGKTYDYYAITQKMRSMERYVRALKREREALKILDMDTSRIQAKIKQKTKEYEKFCDECGVPEQSSRMRYEGSTGDITKTKAYRSYKEQLESKDKIRIPQLPASSISKKIASGEYSTKLSRQQFDKHVMGTAKYKEYLQTRLDKQGNPQSVLTIDAKKAQEVIASKAGTGIIKVDGNGNPKPQEQIVCDTIIGKYYYAKYIDTNKAVIHYGKKVSHIVPIRGDNYD